jgi:hypothetical protein
MGASWSRGTGRVRGEIERARPAGIPELSMK